MNATQTIGDLLAAALVAEDQRHRDEVARWAMVTSASQLARMISEVSNISADEAFSALTLVPDECLPLLTTPHGWCALSCLVAADLQINLTGNVLPTVH